MAADVGADLEKRYRHDPESYELMKHRIVTVLQEKALPALTTPIPKNQFFRS